MTYEEYLAQMKVMGPKVNLNTPPPAPMPSFSPMGNPMTGVGGNSLLGSTPVPQMAPAPIAPMPTPMPVTQNFYPSIAPGPMTGPGGNDLIGSGPIGPPLPTMMPMTQGFSPTLGYGPMPPPMPVPLPPAYRPMPGEILTQPYTYYGTERVPVPGTAGQATMPVPVTLMPGQRMPGDPNVIFDVPGAISGTTQAVTDIVQRVVSDPVGTATSAPGAIKQAATGFFAATDKPRQWNANRLGENLYGVLANYEAMSPEMYDEVISGLQQENQPIFGTDLSFAAYALDPANRQKMLAAHDQGYNGLSGGMAMWQLFQDETTGSGIVGAVQRGLRDVVIAPENAVAAAAPVGGLIRGVGKAGALAATTKQAQAGGKVAQAAGALLEAPGALLNATDPFALGMRGIGALGDARILNRQIPGFRKTANQVAQEANDKLQAVVGAIYKQAEIRDATAAATQAPDVTSLAPTWGRYTGEATTPQAAPVVSGIPSQQAAPPVRTAPVTQTAPGMSSFGRTSPSTLPVTAGTRAAATAPSVSSLPVTQTAIPPAPAPDLKRGVVPVSDSVRLKIGPTKESNKWEVQLRDPNTGYWESNRELDGSIPEGTITDYQTAWRPAECCCPHRSSPDTDGGCSRRDAGSHNGTCPDSRCQRSDTDAGSGERRHPRPHPRPTSGQWTAWPSQHRRR
jgi:hypothetical protein